jgi:hypothetical protein
MEFTKRQIRMIVVAVKFTSETERHDRVVNTPGSYSKGPGFVYRPGDRIS